MKALKSFIAYILAATAFSAATAQPQISWNETHHNFGAFSEDSGKAVTAFEYTNTGTEPLILMGVRTSCGCTLADYSRAPLAPGEKARIIVEYDPTGRLGRFKKSITVDSNTEPRRSKLTISGTVVGGENSVRALYPEARGPIALQRGTALVGDVVKGHMKTVFINAYNQSTDTIRPSFGATPDYLRVTIEPKSIPPGEQASMIIYFRSDLCTDWGLSETEVSVKPDSLSDMEFILPVAATVVEDFSTLSLKDLEKAPVIAVEPERLIFDTIDPADHAAAEVSFEIINRGKSPLTIRRIYSPDPALKISCKGKMTIKRGKRLKVNVSLDPAALAGDILNSGIIIISNDPTTPTMELRAVGEISSR